MTRNTETYVKFLKSTMTGMNTYLRPDLFDPEPDPNFKFPEDHVDFNTIPEDCKCSPCSPNYVDIKYDVTAETFFICIYDDRRVFPKEGLKNPYIISRTEDIGNFNIVKEVFNFHQIRREERYANWNDFD